MVARAKRKSNEPAQTYAALTTQSAFEDAIACAESLVAALDLGKVPAERLIERIERELDIPVLFVDALATPQGESLSGATCHLQDLGLILVNRNESEARRFYGLAHELFHALT
jgi:Zn-dependent peptidase ImmA (M78 family)